jgi:bacterioferritin-associated ferredoxin
MVVCHCNAVNDQAIRASIESGAVDAIDVAEHCGAGASCGSCQPLVERLLAQFGLEPERATAAA